MSLAFSTLGLGLVLKDYLSQKKTETHTMNDE